MKYSYIARMLKLDTDSASPSYDCHKGSYGNNFPWYVCPKFIKKAFKIKTKYITFFLSSVPQKGWTKVTSFGGNLFYTPFGKFSCWSALFNDIDALDNPYEFYVHATALSKEEYNNAK